MTDALKLREALSEANIKVIGANLPPFKDAAYRAENGQQMTSPEQQSYDMLMIFARQIEALATQAARAALTADASDQAPTPCICGATNWRDYYTGNQITHQICFACNAKATLLAARPAPVDEAQALPSTPEEAIAFIGSHYDSMQEHAQPDEIRYQVSVHDLLSAFGDWSDRAPSIELSGDDAEQVRKIWESARADAAMYVEGHCADGSRHAAAIMDLPLPKITMRVPSTDSATAGYVLTGMLGSSNNTEPARMICRQCKTVLGREGATERDAVRAAVREYYDALTARQHGGVAQDRAFNKIQQALGMTWDDHKAEQRAIAAMKGDA